MSTPGAQGSQSKHRKPHITIPKTSKADRFEHDVNGVDPPLTQTSYIAVPITERGHGYDTEKALGKMDPFEVRVRFTGQLSSLSASVTSANKAAQYALKYRDLDEDLHSCILEQLERGNNSMNNRANIMYFIEHLCDMAARENHYDYIRMMQRDIIRMVEAVAPASGSGAANVKVVRKVLQALGDKQFLLPQTVTEIEDLLKERDTLPQDMGLSSPLNESDLPAQDATKSKSGAKPLDKKQVEQRIEEDRERHKRLRENIWAVPSANGGIGEDEFDKLWEETSELGEDDFELYKEEKEEREKSAAEWRDDFARKASGTAD